MIMRGFSDYDMLEGVGKVQQVQTRWLKNMFSNISTFVETHLLTGRNQKANSGLGS